MLGDVKMMRDPHQFSTDLNFHGRRNLLRFALADKTHGLYRTRFSQHQSFFEATVVGREERRLRPRYCRKPFPLEVDEKVICAHIVCENCSLLEVAFVHVKLPDPSVTLSDEQLLAVRGERECCRH